MSTEPVVLYIAGWSRSGSTILANILGSIRGWISVGELHYLWDVGILGREPCGCGEPVPECPFWAQVLARALEGEPADVAREARRVLWESIRTRHTPNLIRTPDHQLHQNPRIAYYARVLGSVYKAVAEQSGAQVIVDSSKYPSDAAVLRLVPGIRPAYVHLVRDPRAVAFSWSRTRRRIDRSGDVMMPRHGPIYSSAHWMLSNVLLEWLSSRHGALPFMVSRYEDLAADPRSEIGRISSWVGTDRYELPFSAPTTARVELAHTVNGNPSRMRAGSVELREDDAWKASLPRWDEAIVTSLCAPQLRRYGYPLLRSRRAVSESDSRP